MHTSSKVFLDQTKTNPDVAVILGSGLTNFFEPQNIIKEISYTDLPDFPQPTVKGHAGKLVLGEIGQRKVVCMYGRSHIYEGHEPQSLAKPIRVLKDIGCKLLIVTNAAGSLDETMPAGSLMAITDHINWSGFNPLIGKNEEDYGPRFHDMSDGYHKFYRDIRSRYFCCCEAARWAFFKCCSRHWFRIMLSLVPTNRRNVTTSFNDYFSIFHRFPFDNGDRRG